MFPKAESLNRAHLLRNTISFSCLVSLLKNTSSLIKTAYICHVRTCPDRSWGPPSLLYSGYQVFPGGKVRPGQAADHSLPSSAVVMDE